jgi:oxazoline/thiazoline synthase
VVVTSEHDALVIEHPFAEPVVRALAVGASKTALRAIDDSSQVVLDRLRAAGAISDGPPSANRGADTFWHEAGVAPAPIAWRPLTSTAVPAIQAVLDRHSIDVRDDGAVLLVTTDDYLHADLPRIARMERRPWLLARPVGSRILLGPVFVPGRSPCWFCLAHWLKMRRPAVARVTGWGDGDVAPQPAIAAIAGTIAIAAGWIGTTATMLSAGAPLPGLDGTIQSLEPMAGRFGEHRIPRRPECETCGTGEGLASLDPRQWLDPVIGLADRLRVSGETQGGFFHAQCRYFYPLPRPGARALLEPGIAYGRGLSREQATLGCAAEAVERYCATWQGDEDVRRGKRHTVRGIDPSSLLHFSEEQYRTRPEVDRAVRHAPDWVPHRFDSAWAVDWIEARGLLSRSGVRVPAAYAFMGYPLDERRRFCVADSNGVAAGESPNAALLSALLEVVERDAVAIWWYNRARRPGIDLRSPALAPVRKARAALQSEGLSVVLLDVTTDVRIPACVAVAFGEAGEPVAMGSAADPSMAVAAHRALGELSQMWFWSHRSDVAVGPSEWFRGMSRLSDAYLVPKGTSKASSVPGTLEGCVAAVRAAGLRAYWIDLTRSEIQIPVVRVVVPGMRHCWRRLGRGRLYDVPVRLGWRTGACPESELNPRLCPI